MALTISVGIPTKNQAEYLEATIESLLQQSRPPDEIVISDHDSTDRTPEIIARYAGRVRTVKPPPGSNLTDQYNFTLASQTSDWITLLSSDDIALPNFCEVLLRGAQRQADAVLVRAGWENFTDAGETLSTKYMLSVPAIEHPPQTLTSQQHGPKVSFAAFAVSRAAFTQSGPILESIESLADWALFLQIAPFGSFITEHALISRYRCDLGVDKFRRRLGMWIRDEVRIFTEVIPQAAARCGMPDTDWVPKASAANFLRYLSSASDQVPPAERAAVAPDFTAWATLVGGEALLQRFTNGERIIRPRSFKERSRDALRPLAHKLAKTFRK